MANHTLARLTSAVVLVLVMSLALAACGSDPTPTPAPTATPTPTPAPTMAPGEPTPTPAPPTPTPTLAPGAPTPTPAPPTPTPPPPTATPDPGFDAEAYFSGKTIEIVVGFAPGGGYDTFSRLVARFSQQYFPGEPRFVVKNLPGGGSRRALTYTMVADPDGLTTHSIHSSIPHAALRGEDLGFDFSQAPIIGGVDCALPTSTGSLYTPRSVATSWDEVLAKGLTLINGMTQPDEGGGTVPRWMEMLGAPIQNITGYGGSSEIMAAFDRGELSATTRGSYTSVPRLYPEWVTDKYHVPILRWGVDPEEDPQYLEWIQQLDAPVPPHVYEVVESTEGQRLILETVLSLNSQFGRTWILPPGTPQEIVDVWREVLRLTAHDDGYHEAANIAGYEPFYCSPEELTDIFANGKRALEEQPELLPIYYRLMGVTPP